MMTFLVVVFFKHKTAYEMRISDWSSDVCSSDLVAVAPIASDHRVTITSDVLTLSLDGGNVFDAQLLQYPQTREPDSPPVKLLDDDPAHYYIARSGWIGQGGTRVPELVPEDPQQREIDLTTGQPTVQVDRKSPRLNSSHYCATRMPSTA